jgi:hypothetical protein
MMAGRVKARRRPLEAWRPDMAGFNGGVAGVG